MKKILSIVFALVICLSLAACGGGVTLDDATDAFNNASVALGSVSEAIGTDYDAYPAELIEELEGYSVTMGDYMAILTADEEPSAEDMEAIIADCNAIEARANEIIEEYGF